MTGCPVPNGCGECRSSCEERPRVTAFTRLVWAVSDLPYTVGKSVGALAFKLSTLTKRNLK